MSVRQQIVDKVFALFAGLPGVGLVIDCADPRQDNRLGEVLASGQAHVQLFIAADESTDGDGSRDVMNTQEFRFAVVAFVTFPQSLLGTLGEGITPTKQATRWYDAVKAAIWGQGRGGQWDDMAMRTVMLGGGGVSYDTTEGANLIVTEIAFEVTHRHLLGEPGVVK